MIEFSKACVHDFSGKDDKDALLMPYYDQYLRQNENKPILESF